MKITETLTSVAPITVACYLIGIVIKATPLNNKYIPAIVGILGGILGALSYFIAPELVIANDVITAVAVGIVSGLASTGANQIGKQLKTQEHLEAEE